jgi:hypothetical protein
MTHTIAELERRRQDLEFEVGVCERRGSTYVAGLHRQSILEVDRQIEAARQQMARSSMATVLRPVREYHRSGFMPDLAEHAIDTALKLKVNVEPCLLGEERADVETRTIFTPGVTTEASYAIVLHEIAHVVDPLADARQHRYSINRTMCSPLAEAAAWLWAVEHCWRQFWTMPMQSTLANSLDAYRAHAEGLESVEIERVVAVGFGSVRPAPDTGAGRQARVRQIEREQKLANSGTAVRLRRLEAQGIRVP